MAHDGLRRYTEFFERLSPDSLADIASVMTDDVRFVDPFNDVTGIDKTENIFRHMFDSISDARFTVKHAGMAEGSDTEAMISWVLDCRFRGKPYQIVGMSDVVFAPDGRVISHVDHWDAAQQFYEHLPIVGWLLRGIRRRLQP
jgi:steroid delta-isomerase